MSRQTGKGSAAGKANRLFLGDLSVSLIPGITELLSTKALLGFARLRLGLDNTHVCHLCREHRACCSPQCHLAHAVPRALPRMEPFQAGCQNL